MASLTASTDFRRSNHERTQSESSVWIDDYLNNGLNAEDLLDPHLRDNGLNLLAPFEDCEDLQSALSQFIPDCAFSEFDGVEPVDIETVEAEQLFRSTNPRDPSQEVSSSSTQTERARNAKHFKQSSCQNVSCDSVPPDPEGFTQPSLPAPRCLKSLSPKKAPSSTGSPRKWLGAHPSSTKNPRASEANTKSEAPRTSEVAPMNSDKIRLDGILVSSPQKRSPSSKNRKIVSQALLEKLKAASKKAARQSILISAPVTQQPAKPYFVSLDHDYCVDITKGEKDDLEVQPMELEPEHERGVSRIEVLPELSLAAREIKLNQKLAAANGEALNARVLDGERQRLGVVEDNVVFEECANVINEEVVTSFGTGSPSSDSGFESSIRVDDGGREGRSRRRWLEDRGRKSRSPPSQSSDSSSDSSDDSRSKSRRSKKESYSRRRGSRSRSSSRRRSRSSKRRRTRSRDSSPESNSGSDGRRSYREKSTSSNRRSIPKPVRRERKNIWAMSDRPKTFPFMPPLNKPGQKTVMQSALEEIERGGDRQVLYVGQIKEGTTRDFIREKFSRFGPIAEVSLHFRETGENYAFVTFHRPKDAYHALDNAALLPDFKLCFGGRRQFCGRKWSDLDNEQERAYLNTGSKDLDRKQNDFDSLLNELKTASMRR